VGRGYLAILSDRSRCIGAATLLWGWRRAVILELAKRRLLAILAEIGTGSADKSAFSWKRDHRM
jgi:hypothetical protein